MLSPPLIANSSSLHFSVKNIGMENNTSTHSIVQCNDEGMPGPSVIIDSFLMTDKWIENNNVTENPGQHQNLRKNCK